MALNDKVVIITGAAQGIGRFVARTFAAEGARLALADVAPLDTSVGEVEARSAQCLPIKTDVTNEEQVRFLMDQVYRRWGRIDVLINDAANVTHFHTGSPRWPRIRDMPREFFQKVIDTNLVGTFLCTKHVLPYMESLNGGHIINFGQGGFSTDEPEGARSFGACVYRTSKLAIRAFTRSVAAEERDFNICIVSLGPGAPAAGLNVDGLGGIVTDDSPEWARESRTSRGVESVGNRYLIAAEAPMEFSGHQVVVRDGKLDIAPP